MARWPCSFDFIPKYSFSARITVSAGQSFPFILELSCLIAQSLYRIKPNFEVLPRSLWTCYSFFSNFSRLDMSAGCCRLHYVAVLLNQSFLKRLFWQISEGNWSPLADLTKTTLFSVFTFQKQKMQEGLNLSTWNMQKRLKIRYTCPSTRSSACLPPYLFSSTIKPIWVKFGGRIP